MTVSLNKTIKKKVCMVGDFAVGKTSLTQKFVNNVFSDKYLTTVGVKIDTVDAGDMKLVIWDVAGRDSLSPINTSYLVGAAGVILVADGTRMSTIEALDQLKSTVQQRIGDEVPFVVAINKYDDTENWLADERVLKQLADNGYTCLLTSAKDGQNVQQLFDHLASEITKS